MPISIGIRLVENVSFVLDSMNVFVIVFVWISKLKQINVM